MILSNFDRIYSTIWKHLVASLCRGQEAFGRTAEEVKAIKSLRATGHRSCGGKCKKPALRRTHGFRYLEKVEKKHAPYVWVSGWNITGCLRTAFASSFVHAQAQLAKIKAPKGRHFKVFTPRIWIVTEKCKKTIININIWVESSTGFGPGFDSK